MRISTQGEPEEDTQFDKFWGMSGQILNNDGDSASLVTYTGGKLACTAWGTKSC